MKKRVAVRWMIAVLLCGLLMGGCGEIPGTVSEPAVDTASLNLSSDAAYTVLNDNEPSFQEADFTKEPFEFYGELDELGRCQTAFANICKELMPVEERGSIGSVKPTGWHTVKYDIVDGKYLYNRCHLIGFQLAGENANEKNLITGTRYMNVEGMLPFENMVADFVEETDYHVLYRVTPVFEGDNLVASGVEMEAESVEDNGDGICFHVFVPNIQPGITIDYATGESSLAGEYEEAQNSKGQVVLQNEAGSGEETYILNTNTKKFHMPGCSSAADMKESNKEEFTGSRKELLLEGYEACKRCKP